MMFWLKPLWPNISQTGLKQQIELLTKKHMMMLPLLMVKLMDLMPRWPLLCLVIIASKHNMMQLLRKMVLPVMVSSKNSRKLLSKLLQMLLQPMIKLQVQPHHQVVPQTIHLKRRKIQQLKTNVCVQTTLLLEPSLLVHQLPFQPSLLHPLCGEMSA